MEQTKIFTKEQCGIVLERYTKSKNFEIKSYSLKPINSQLDEYISNQFFLKIYYKIESEENIAHFFLKCLSQSSPMMFEAAKSILAYEKESFYYETVVPLLKSKGFSCDYLPKCYFCEPHVIVLEDLSQRGFKGTSKLKPLNLQHCKKCLETLAKFHAETIAYQMEKSKDLSKDYCFKDEYSHVVNDRVFTDKETAGSKFMYGSVEGLCDLIDLIPENGVSTFEFKKSLQNELKFLNHQGYTPECRCTLLHGDLWSNNFLFRYGEDDNEITDCVVIDFQTQRYGPPAMDVMQFLFSNSRKDFRRQHQQELLVHYYKVFSDLLNEKHLSEGVNESAFQKCCQVYSVPAKLLAVVDRSITFISEEVYMSAIQSEEDLLRYLYTKRGKYMVSEFKKNEKYREVMTEDLVDLRDMLFDED